MNEKVILVVNILKIPIRFPLYPNKIHTSNFLSISNIHVQSKLNYISEYGAVVTKESTRQVENKPIRIYNYSSKPATMTEYANFNKNLFLDPYQEHDHRIKSFLKAQNNIVFFMPSAIYSLLDNSKPTIRSQVETIKKQEQESKSKYEYSVNGVTYFILAVLIKFSKDVELLFEFSEVDKAPFYVHFMVHLPLIISTLIIFLIILSFETGINENIIDQEISKLPLTKYEKRLGFSDCSVCLEPFEESNTVRILKCNHCFHQNCIDSWLKTMLKCPICRNSVSKLADSPRYQMYQSINTI